MLLNEHNFDGFREVELKVSQRLITAFGIATFNNLSEGQITLFKGVFPNGDILLKENGHYNVIKDEDIQSAFIIDTILAALKDTRNPKSIIPKKYHRALGL